MDIKTPRPNKSKPVTTYLSNKLVNAEIQIKKGTPSSWPEYLLSKIKVTVPNNVTEEVKGILEEMAILDLGWFVDKAHENVNYIRISGKWHLEGRNSLENIKYVVYKINRPSKYMLKSKSQDITTTESKSNTAKVFKTSELIVKKGADSDKKIKVYSTSGIEIK